MVKIEKEQVVDVAKKAYTPAEINRIKSIVKLVTVDSAQKLSHINYNNWTNHNEYSKGY